LLSPEEEERYNTEIDGLLSEIERDVQEVEKRRLTKEQLVTLDRIRGFVAQVRETRQADVVTARGMATRASVLARDLERSTR
jgi:hypothetical protein